MSAVHIFRDCAWLTASSHFLLQLLLCCSLGGFLFTDVYAHVVPSLLNIWRKSVTPEIVLLPTQTFGLQAGWWARSAVAGQGQKGTHLCL